VAEKTVEGVKNAEDGTNYREGIPGDDVDAAG